MTVGWFKVRIDILLPVLVIFEVLNSLTVRDILRFKEDFNHVGAFFLLLYRQKNALFTESASFSYLHSIYFKRVDRSSLIVNEDLRGSL